MMRSLLPILGLVLVLPGAVVGWRAADISGTFTAFATPADLMAGCTDVPEAVALVQELRVRERRIENYMESIDQKKGGIQDANERLTSRLIELRQLKDKVSATQSHAKQDVVDDISRLVSVYEAMKPQEAAAILTNLPPDFSAEILMRVAPESGAKIIAAVDPSQAAILTTYMGARRAGKK